MRDRVTDTARWVEAGHITEAQRAAILASESMGPDMPVPIGVERPVRTDAPEIRLPRRGLRAEVFVFGLGGLLALIADWVASTPFGGSPFPVLTPPVILALVGFTLLIGVRGGAILADVALGACLWMYVWATATLGPPGSAVLSMIVGLFIAFVGALRLVRLVVAAPAAGLAFLYISSSFPMGDDLILFLVSIVVLLLTTAFLITSRDRIRIWSNRLWGGRLGD